MAIGGGCSLHPFSLCSPVCSISTRMKPQQQHRQSVPRPCPTCHGIFDNLYQIEVVPSICKACTTLTSPIDRDLMTQAMPFKVYVCLYCLSAGRLQYCICCNSVGTNIEVACENIMHDPPDHGRPGCDNGTSNPFANSSVLDCHPPLDGDSGYLDQILDKFDVKKAKESEVMPSWVMAHPKEESIVINSASEVGDELVFEGIENLDIFEDMVVLNPDGTGNAEPSVANILDDSKAAIPTSTQTVQVNVPDTNANGISSFTNNDHASYSIPHTLNFVHMEKPNRREILQRFKEKRKRRNFEKTIRYASRKAYAEVRPRIKGRFTKRNDS